MSVKGFTYQISQEQGLFSFAADVSSGTNVWFKKYSTPSAFEAEEAEFGSSWSWMGNPGAIQAPGNGSINPEKGAKLSVHRTWGDTATLDSTLPRVDKLRGLEWTGQYFYVSADNGGFYRYDENFNFQQSITNNVTNLHGFAWDGEYLWSVRQNGDNSSDFIYQLDEQGNVKSSIQSIGTRPLDLAWDGNYLWNTDGRGQNIYKMKTDGTKINSFGVSDTFPVGIAQDGVYLYYFGSASNTLEMLDKQGNVKRTANPFKGRQVAWDGDTLFITPDNNMVYRWERSGNFDISYRVSSIV